MTERTKEFNWSIFYTKCTRTCDNFFSLKILKLASIKQTQKYCKISNKVQIWTQQWRKKKNCWCANHIPEQSGTKKKFPLFFFSNQFRFILFHLARERKSERKKNSRIQMKFNSNLPLFFPMNNWINEWRQAKKKRAENKKHS